MLDQDLTVAVLLVPLVAELAHVQVLAPGRSDRLPQGRLGEPASARRRVQPDVDKHLNAGRAERRNDPVNEH